MNKTKNGYKFTSLIVVVVWLVAACAATPAEHSYVTDYQVIGDKTVKYIYLPGDKSEGGAGYLDQGLAMEICSLQEVEVEVEVEDDEVDDDEYDDQEKLPPQTRLAEVDCQETRVLKTEEYR